MSKNSNEKRSLLVSVNNKEGNGYDSLRTTALNIPSTLPINNKFIPFPFNQGQSPAEGKNIFREITSVENKQGILISYMILVNAVIFKDLSSHAKT